MLKKVKYNEVKNLALFISSKPENENIENLIQLVLKNPGLLHLIVKSDVKDLN